MAQQKFQAGPGDPIAEVGNANFTELYTSVAANTTALALLTPPGTPFNLTANLTSAAAATPVHIVPIASVGALQKVFVTDVYLKVGGGTAWTDVTATKIQLQDTAGTPILAMTFLKALLTGNVVLSNAQASTLLAALVDGLTAGKGLDIVGDANFAAGSTITIRVMGYIL